MNCLGVVPREGLWLEELAQTSVEELFGPDNRLPWELVLHIFFHLDISALGQAGCVNKDWKEVADSDVLWGPIYRHRFLAQMPLWTLAMADNSWKRACKQVALLPVIGTSCSGAHSGSFYTGHIVRVLQGVCVDTTTDPTLIFAPSLPTCIQPVARIRPVPGDGLVPPTTLADLVQGKRKANHERNVKSDLAREVLACLDEVDLCDTEWGKALGTGPEEGDPLFQLTKSQLLNKLLATKATGQSIETSEDPMMDQLLAARYRTYNSTAISIRTTELTNTKVIVAQSDEDRYCMPGTITGLTSEGLIMLDSMTALPLNSFQRKVSLNTLDHSLHEDLMTAIYNSDDASLRDLEIFIENGDHWGMSCITRVSKPCFVFEVSFEHWSKWFTLDQLQDFSQDMHSARKAFWKTVADIANVPPADPALLGKRMLIQNKSQNLGGRIIQSHGPGTITSDPAQSKIAYTYEKATDLAEGKYTVSRQYHVVMESSGLSCWLGAERLFHFTGAPDTIAVGDRVLSEWRPNNWYVGTVTHATPGGWHVAYDDGDHQDDLAPSSLMHIEAARYVPPTDSAQ